MKTKQKALICGCGFTGDNRKIMKKHEDLKNKTDLIEHFHIENKDNKIPKEGKWYVGQVGIDSGTVLIVDPCYIRKHKELYVEDDWNGFCNDMSEHEHNPHEAFSGVVSSTGHGDGGYPVYATIGKDGVVNKLEVIFSRWVNDRDYEKYIEYDTETVQQQLEYFKARHKSEACPNCGSEHVDTVGFNDSINCKKIIHDKTEPKIHIHWKCNRCNKGFVRGWKNA